MPKKIKPQNISNALGEFIAKWADQHNLSLSAVADEANVSQSYISDIVNGKKVPEAGVCKLIADALYTPQVKILSLAGWLDLSEDEVLVESFRERVKKDHEFADFIKLLLYEDNDNWSRLIIKMMRVVIDCGA